MSIVPFFTQSKFPTFGSLRESLWLRILGPFLLVTSLTTCSNGDSENGLFSEFVPGPMIPDNVILLEAGPDLEQRAQEDRWIKWGDGNLWIFQLHDKNRRKRELRLYRYDHNDDYDVDEDKNNRRSYGRQHDQIKNR